jgi:NAD+ kinase
MDLDMTNSFENIAVLAHPLIENSLERAAEVAGFLTARGVQAESGYLNHEGFRQRVEQNEFSLVVTLGGDGTVLRAGHLCAPVGVPILPINMGSFGFLIELSLATWKPAMERLLAGDFWLENRMMLRTKLWRGEKCLGSWDVLNEAVIARGETLRPVHLSASLDGEAVTVFVADALIVSTPTGSTAYALAAGGPIMPPTLRNILLVPVAPHLSMERPIVLAEGVTVRITVIGRRPAVLMVDGQVAADLEDRDTVSVAASPHMARFARVREQTYFYKTLVSRLVPRNQK